VLKIFLKTCLRVELLALFALIVCACLVAIYGLADSLRLSAKGLSPLVSPIDAAFGGFIYVVFFGALPVIFYAAPAYAFLSHKGTASWFMVLLIGIVPGAIIFLFSQKSLAVWFMTCGAVIACITHFLSLRCNRKTSAQPNQIHF
jgi:hypothetical protein